MYYTDKACFGCQTGKFLTYPPIKLPNGKLDASRYPAIDVEYLTYCYDCVQAILTPPTPRRKWWQFWLPRHTRVDTWRVSRGLNPLTKQDLEQIYADLPRPR